MLLGIGAIMNARKSSLVLPNQIPDLAYWLNADLGVTLISGAVDSWADQSGNGRDFLAPSSLDRPKFNSSFAGGRAYLYTDATNQVLKLSGFTQRYRTVSMIFQYVDDSTDGILYSQDDPSGVGTPGFLNYAFLDFPVSGTDTMFNYVNSNNGGPRFVLDGNVHYITYVCDVNNIDLYVDGVFTAFATLDVKSTTTDHAVLNYNTTPVIYSWPGGIRNLINYDRALNSTELGYLHTYQATQL